jgi:DNA-binding MarR family transcriptional regulator
MADTLPGITKDEYQALAAFRHALRKFLHFSEQAAVAAGLTPQQHQALLAVKGSLDESLTIGELAERLQLRHHSAVGLVNRLVSQRLLKRHRSTTDRRQVHLMLTSSGECLLRNLSAAHREELRRVGPQLKLLLEHFNED